MTWRSVVVGGLGVLATQSVRDLLALSGDSDVVLLPTAAAFTGATEAAVHAAAALEATGARIEALMVTDRASANEEYFARRVGEADVVLLLDGSPLHARACWRDSAVGAALMMAGRLVAVGSVATVLGDEMIDPRGGAPTTGLGYRSGAVLTTRTSEDQLRRTRELLGEQWTMLTLGEDDAVIDDDGTWWALVGNPTASIGAEVAPMGRFTTR